MAKTAMQLSLDARLAIGGRAAGISLGRAAQHWQELLVHFAFDGEGTRLDGGSSEEASLVAVAPASAAGNSVPGRASGVALLLGGGLAPNAPQRVMSTAPLLGAYAAVSVAMDGASAQLLKIPIHGADVGIEVVRCRVLEPIPTHGKLYVAEYDPRLGFGLGAPIVFGKTILAPNAAVESVHGVETCGGADGGACSRDGYYVFYIGYKAVYNVVDLISYEVICVLYRVHGRVCSISGARPAATWWTWSAMR